MSYNDLKRIHTRTDQIHTSHNASVSFSTMHHSDQKCVLFCSDWCAVGNGTGIWDVWIWSIVILVMNARRHSRWSVTYKYTQFSSALIWFWFAAWNIVKSVSSDNHVTNSGLNSDLYCLGGRDARNNRCHWEEGGVEVSVIVANIPYCKRKNCYFSEKIWYNVCVQIYHRENKTKTVDIVFSPSQCKS